MTAQPTPTSSFDEAIESMALLLEQVEGMALVIAVSNDASLRDHAVRTLAERLSSGKKLQEFRYDPAHLSLLEAVAELPGGPGVAVSATGLEALRHDQRIEAIKLLNLQRNRLGRTELAIVLWVDEATLAEISRHAADFYSWRSGAFLIQAPTGWSELESARRGYLQALLRHNELISLQGLAPARGGQVVQMRMDEIFVPPPIEQAVEIAASVSLSPLGKGAGSRSGERALSEPGRSARPVDLAEVLHAPRAVVLGDPGAGKSTLLRYLASTVAGWDPPGASSENRELAGCLPVPVSLGEYAQYLVEAPAASLEAFAPGACKVRGLPLDPDLLAQAVASGRVVFLLDGLDEVTLGRRGLIADRIRELSDRHPACRMVVSSRIVGYREAGLGPGFSVFTISPFGDGEIRRFVECWYRALGDPADGERLVEAIGKNPAIHRLASNPLLLTVLALLAWRGITLPHRRVKLYAEASETLVDQWMTYRRVKPEDWDVEEIMHVLLPAIAWHLHRTRPQRPDRQAGPPPPPGRHPETPGRRPERARGELSSLSVPSQRQRAQRDLPGARPGRGRRGRLRLPSPHL